jgi:broad specificity phosphatase PhoE
MPRRILILRHGRTTWNADRRYQGQQDPPLDEIGHAQAIEAAALVASMSPDLVVSSDLQRAKHTADKLASLLGIRLQVDERLRERHLGHWQGLTREEVASRYPDEFAEWAAGHDVSRRGGESRDEVARRACELVSELPEVGLTVLVSHSATAMCLSAALLGLPQTPSIIGPLANGHWAELRAVGTGWMLYAHNAGPPGLVVPRLTPESDYSDAEA